MEYNGSLTAGTIYSTSQPSDNPRLGDRGIRYKSFLEVGNMERAYTIKSLIALEKNPCR
jgi:hypothetical protein